MKILKWIGFTVLGICVVGALVAGGGFFWLKGQLKQAMAPQEVNEAVPSLHTYLRDTPPTGTAFAYDNLQGFRSVDQLFEQKTARPWTRWWWPGGDVDAARACEQLARLETMGFGGVEIQSFNAGLMFIEDEETQSAINAFGTDAYHDTLAEVMVCARAANMQVYLNHLSGWPAGGPEVPVDEGMKELTFAEIAVKGGEPVELKLPVPQPGYNDYIMAIGERLMGFDLTNFVVEERNLLSVVAGRPIRGERSGNPLDATDTIELDPESIIVLTDQVKDETLSWSAPEGDWLVIAVYVQPSGEAPTLIASERAGYVIDHMDADIVRGHYEYAYGARSGLEPYYGNPFAGFFNDSLEFKISRFAANDILDAFEARRGYDLEPFLPTLFRPARDNFFITETMRHRPADEFYLTDLDERVRYDYQETISDLIIERFVETSAEWAEMRGLVSKGQSYGADFDVIRAMGQNTMPESEQLFAGGGETVLKMASASGDLYGRPIISAESFVWYKLAYGVAPAQLKMAADKLFASGINQIIYHGIPYEPEGEAYDAYFGELDWYPFSGPKNDSNFSGNYGPDSPVWNILPELNTYLTSVQTLLQSGRQQSDVFIYYPFLGFPHEIEDSEAFSEEFLFMGQMPGAAPRAHEPPMDIPFVKLPDLTEEEKKDVRLRWLERVKPLLDELNAAGISWTWINDEALTRIDRIAGAKSGVVIADAPWIQRDALEALASWDGHQERLVFWGALPEKQPGFKGHVANDDWIAKTVSELSVGRSLEAVESVSDHFTPRLGYQGRFPDMRRYTRVLENGAELHFLFNQSETGHELPLVPGASFDNAYWFDPVDRVLSVAVPDEAGQFSLYLDGLETRFLVLSPEPMQGAVEAGSTDIMSSTLLNGWTLQAGEDTREYELLLPDLREDDALRYKADALVYRTDFTVDGASSCNCGYELNLDRVAGVAAVRLNGDDLGSVSLPPFRLDISQSIQDGLNELEITVQQPLRNQMVGRALASDELFAHMAQHENALSAMGLIGQVRLEKRR